MRGIVGLLRQFVYTNAMNTFEADRWIRSSENDLAMALTLREDHFYDGCAFHAQQASEKALKGLLYALDELPWGHSCFILIRQVAEQLSGVVTPEFIEASHRIDEH